MKELEDLIRSGWTGLSDDAIARIVRFYELLLDENTRQNLTRLTSPQDFYDGHLEDVKHLLDSGLLTYPALDLGSGGGVPGLLAAAAQPAEWILCDSEKSKAEFLRLTAEKLGLSQVSTFAGRGEAYLRSNSVSCIVARAVGPVDRVYAWLEQCSTWNKLILLKGPGWDAEWAAFVLTKHRNALRVSDVHDYSVSKLEKIRKIVVLERVPRGTTNETRGLRSST